MFQRHKTGARIFFAGEDNASVIVCVQYQAIYCVRCYSLNCVPFSAASVVPLGVRLRAHVHYASHRSGLTPLKVRLVHASALWSVLRLFGRSGF